MTNQITTLEVQHRFILGKQVKELRREGVTPVHLYGPGISSQSLQVDGAILTRVLSESGRTRPLMVQIAPDGEEHLVFIGNVQFHPVTNAVIHVDFLRVDVNMHTQAQIPLALGGSAPAVRRGVSMLLRGVSTVTISSLPLNVPDAIVADISGLDDLEKVLRVGDLIVPEGVEILSDAGQMVAQVVPIPNAEIDESESPALVDDDAIEQSDQETVVSDADEIGT